MASVLPILGRALPIREVRALESLQETSGERYHVAPAEAPDVLLRREYASDAHFCAYYPTEDGVHYTGEDYPRIRKSCLPELLALAPPTSGLLGQYLVYDLDNPQHLDHPSAHAAQEHLHRLWAPPDPAAPRPAFAYTSRHGLRVGYLLPEPQPVLRLEELHRALLPRVQEVAGAALLVDPACSDWTHLFRLPKVARQGPHLPLESAATWFALRVRDPADVVPLDPTGLLLRASPHPRPWPPPAPPLRPAPPSGTGVPVQDHPPSDEEASLLLEALAPHAPAHALGLELRRRTQNRICDAVLWRNQELAPAAGPGRSTAIFRVGGDAVRWFYPVPGATPELLYALLWQQVAAWEPTSIPHPHDRDPDGRGWLEHLWSALATFWTREWQRDPDPEATREPLALLPERAARQHTLLGRIVEGARTWPGTPLPLDAEAAQLWVQSHLIAVVGAARDEYYLLRPDGYYDGHRVSSSALIPAIRDLGLADLISLDAVTAAGAVRPRTPLEIVRTHGTRVLGRRLRVGLQAPGSGRPAAVLAAEGPDGDCVLEYSAYARRADLRPTPDPDVAAWLLQFAGPDQVDDLERWVAWALALEEGPICALALRGASGAGKKLFARGLAECFTPPGRFATGYDLGHRREGLLESPILLVDEGIPEPAAAGAADVFRQLIAGERVRIEPKYCAPVQASVPVRCLFTTNNLDVISALAGGRDLTRDDQEAVARRLLLIEIPEACPAWLAQQGGIAHTRGWVDGDGGEPGGARVARHFLHLHAQRHRWPTGERFLVEGRAQDPAVRDALLLGSPATATVLEALVALVERGGAAHEIQVAAPFLWVSSAAVLERARKVARAHPGVRPPTLRTVGHALRAWCLPGAYAAHRAENVRMHGLDVATLARQAEAVGLRCERLLAFAAGDWAVPPAPALQVLAGGRGA